MITNQDHIYIRHFKLVNNIPDDVKVYFEFKNNSIDYYIFPIIPVERIVIDFTLNSSIEI